MSETTYRPGQWLESRYNGYLVEVVGVGRTWDDRESVSVRADGKTVNTTARYLSHCYKPLGDA